MTAGFIDKHDLWTETQRHQAAELKRRLDQEDLKLVRLAWADPHGYSRAKAVTIPAFWAASSKVSIRRRSPFRNLVRSSRMA